MYEFRNHLPRFRTVGKAEPATDAEALKKLADPTFHVEHRILLADYGPVGEGDEGEAGGVQIVEDTPTRIRLRAERKSPGWLTGVQTYFPGWKAEVNGVEKPVYRANVAFAAVPVPPGVSDVVLYYDPASFKIGVFLSVSGFAAFAFMIWRAAAKSN